MSNYKVCIYFKGKEKPLILTDAITKDFTYDDSVKYFTDILKNENKVITLDFSNDIVIFNCKDVDAIKVSKPILNETIVTTDDEDVDISVEEGKFIKDEKLKTEFDTAEEDDDEVFDSADSKIEIVED